MNRQPPVKRLAAGRDLDQAQLIIVRWTTLPGIHLGNPSLIDAKIGRDVVLHMPEGKAASNFTNDLISQFCAETFRWSLCHTFTFSMYDQS